jgi:phage terminase small subunit
MPVLTNAKWELFAQHLAKGKTANEAYELAGYTPNDGNCIRLKGNESISTRVAELLSRSAKRVEVTVESLIAEVEEARQLALANRQAAAAVAATREKGVLAGKRVERSEHGKPGDFDRMDDDELEAFITAGQNPVGASITGETAPHHQTGMRKPSGLH